MPVEFDRGSPGKFDPRTLSRKTLNRWTGRTLDYTLRWSEMIYGTPYVL